MKVTNFTLKTAHKPLHDALELLLFQDSNYLNYFHFDLPRVKEHTLNIIYMKDAHEQRFSTPEESIMLTRKPFSEKVLNELSGLSTQTTGNTQVYYLISY